MRRIAILQGEERCKQTEGADTTYDLRSRVNPICCWKYPEMQRQGKELLNNKWPYINQEIALRKIFAAKNATKQR
jgi:hypothetical protein